MIAVAVVALSAAVAFPIESAMAAHFNPNGPIAAALRSVPVSILVALPILLPAMVLFKRRFERQADVAGCRLASWAATSSPPTAEGQLVVTPDGVELFSAALRHVIRLNGLDESERTWFSPSFEERRQFLEMLARDPDLAERFDRRTTWMVNVAVATCLILAAAIHLTARG